MTALILTPAEATSARCGRPGPDAFKARRLLRLNRCGEPVGWRSIDLEPDFTTPCQLGCLAPGSSPHVHAVRTGFLLIGTTGYVETDVDLLPTGVGTIHPLT